MREYRLPREALQPEHLTCVDVWEALLEDMPMTALIRNLATMTRLGVIAPGSAARRRSSRSWPTQAAPQGTRAPDRGARGAQDVRVRPRRPRPRRVESGREVVDALDAAFYATFGNVEPTGKRLLLALDVSGSMTGAASRACRA